MRRRDRASAAAVLGLLCSMAGSAAAEPPAGSYTIPIHGASGLVLFSGQGYGWCRATLDGQVCLSTDVETDASGRVTGTGFLSLDGASGGEAELALDGQVSGTPARPRIALSFGGAGTAADGVSELRSSGQLRCAIGSVALFLGLTQLDCKGNARICTFRADTVQCVRVPAFTSVAAVRTGFQIQLELATDAMGAVTGTGKVRIGDTELATYAATGRYQSSADTVELALDGVDPNAKTRIALRGVALEADAASSGTARFAIAGQRGGVELPSPPPAVPCYPEWSFCDPIPPTYDPYSPWSGAAR